MRALTGSEVLVADKLFATLDTTVRALQPETQPRVLVSDTVGFIKKLPHDLVASFRSTLDEALEASLLLYVVDASDPTFREPARGHAQRAARRSAPTTCRARSCSTRSTGSTTRRARRSRASSRDAILLSAKRPGRRGRAPRRRIIDFFEAAMVEDELVVPYAQAGARRRGLRERARARRRSTTSAARRSVQADPATLARLTSCSRSSEAQGRGQASAQGFVARPAFRRVRSCALVTSRMIAG